MTADDVINGACCSECGIYFNGKEHGYPVLCQDCWYEQPTHEKRKRINTNGLQKSLFRGV